MTDPTTRRPVLVVAIAPPAAGKSTWILKRARAHERVNLDTYRAFVADDEGDQSATNEAAALQGIILKGRLRRGLTTFVDSTNAASRRREELVNVGRQFDAFTVAVVWDLPLSVCIERNRSRERRVPVEVIERMHLAIRTEIPKGPVPDFDVTRRIGTHDVRFGRVPAAFTGAAWLR